MKIVQIEHVSEMTGIPVATLRFWRHKGTGPRSFKLGGRVAYKVADVEAWIERQYEAAS